MFSTKILPSSYSWLIPPYDSSALDKLASENKFPTLDGLLPSLGWMVFFGVWRVLLTHFLFKPLAIYAMNIPSNDFKKDNNLELLFKNIRSKTLTDSQLETISKDSKTDLSLVKKYYVSRTNERINNLKITKFVEALWRFLFYSYFTYLGLNFLIFPTVSDFIWDPKLLYLNWPNFDISSSIIFYHQIQLGSYLHQLMWTEVSRSDSIEMILHHITTIMLILISHCLKFHKTGSLTFFLHDISDVFLEIAKCFNYASKAKNSKKFFSNKFFSTISDILFAIFAISFFVLRLVIYPKLIVYSLVVNAKEILGIWPGYYFISILLSTLVFLHIFWFYLISKMIYKLLTTGIEKDERSDDEEEIDVDNNKEKITHKKTK